jgi:hypothetical protein
VSCEGGLALRGSDKRLASCSPQRYCSVMEISDEELCAFQSAYEVDFGEEITEDEAREMLTRLVVLYERLAKPLPRRDAVRYE